tara:strand:- start:35 stop:508 length:474 start_codon:yes stop_codon:yes gene_type:complete
MSKIPKILFLHGREGTPEGSKVTYLRDCGYRVISPVLPKDNWNLSIQRAQSCFDAFLPDIIVGSSRGGAIACNIQGGNTPKILIAPAYNKFNCQIYDVDDSTIVLHCPTDKIVAFEDSKKLVEAFNVDLRSCGVCHRMKDPDALKHLITAIKEKSDK